MSDPFRRLNFDCNDNYRFVELCIQRVLGRSVYSQAEKTILVDYSGDERIIRIY